MNFGTVRPRVWAIADNILFFWGLAGNIAHIILTNPQSFEQVINSSAFLVIGGPWVLVYIARIIKEVRREVKVKRVVRRDTLALIGALTFLVLATLLTFAFQR